MEFVCGYTTGQFVIRGNENTLCVLSPRASEVTNKDGGKRAEPSFHFLLLAKLSFLLASLCRLVFVAHV